MTDKDHDETETEHLRDKALLRALSTPPKPHSKGEGEGKKRQESRRKKQGRSAL